MVEVTLTFVAIQQLFSHDDFFDRVPMFADLRELAGQSRVTRCGGCSLQKQLEHLADAFGRVVLTAWKEDKESLRPLLHYIADRRGASRVRVVMYHKIAGKAQRLVLHLEEATDGPPRNKTRSR